MPASPDRTVTAEMRREWQSLRDGGASCSAIGKRCGFSQSCVSANTTPPVGINSALQWYSPSIQCGCTKHTPSALPVASIIDTRRLGTAMKRALRPSLAASSSPKSLRIPPASSLSEKRAMGMV